MSGGTGLPAESSGGVSRPKICIWRSGGPNSMGKHIVPESPPHYFMGNIAIFGHVLLPTAAGPDGLSDRRNTHQKVCLNLRNTYKTNEKPIFLWSEC